VDLRGRWITASETPGCAAFNEMTKVISKIRKALGIRIPKPDLSLPAKVYRVNRYRYPHESEQDAMRGDWEKIGADFHVSIEKSRA
jgi:hypothetical protein